MSFVDRINENELNNKLWDQYYQSYQKDSTIPGIKFPNEHLVRFIASQSQEAKKKEMRVLELGFGNITNMTMMHRMGFKVYGLEVSEDSVRRARLGIKEKGLEDHLSVDVFSGGTLPLTDNSFDVIVGLECVYYNLDQKLFAQECARVLKPGGKIYFSFFSHLNGYMDYIEGQPGGVVEFKDNHPNPRLRGLTLFLYASRKQFLETYGVCFDIAVGLEEFDLYDIYNSWYHLTGQKKDSSVSLSFIVSEPTQDLTISPPLEYLPSLEEMTVNNISLWEKKYEAMYESDVIPGSQYPNETMVRFLATRNRGDLNKFFTHIGKEDHIKAQGENVLELMPINITNLAMMTTMNFKPYGLSTSDTVVSKGQEAVLQIQKEDIVLSKIENNCFDYEDKFFNYIVSEKMGSHMPDQEILIRETARVIKPGGEILIGYLSEKHGYLSWVDELGEGYFKISSRHPDPTMRGIILFVQTKNVLKQMWSCYFDVEITFTEFDLYRHFSSFYFVRGKRNDTTLQ